MKKYIFVSALGLLSGSIPVKAITTHQAPQTVTVPTNRWELFTSRGKTCDYSEKYTQDARKMAEEIGGVDAQKINVYTSEKVGSCAYPDKDIIVINTQDAAYYPDDVRSTLAHEVAHVKYNKNALYTTIPLHFGAYIVGYNGIPKILNYVNKKFFRKNKTVKRIAQSELFKAVCGLVTSGLCLNLYLKNSEYRADTTAITYLKSTKDKAALYNSAQAFKNCHKKELSKSPLLSLVSKYCGTVATEIFDTITASVTFNLYSYFDGHPSSQSRALRFKRAAESIKD